VYLMIVFLSVILPMLLLSSKLKRNLIIDLNLTQGRTISDGCNSSIVPDIGVEDERIPTISGEKVML
jgi:hypothetical protein